MSLSTSELMTYGACVLLWVLLLGSIPWNTYGFYLCFACGIVIARFETTPLCSKCGCPRGKYIPCECTCPKQQKVVDRWGYLEEYGPPDKRS